jgi:hypothetical protein
MRASNRKTRAPQGELNAPSCQEARSGPTSRASWRPAPPSARSWGRSARGEEGANRWASVSAPPRASPGRRGHSQRREKTMTSREIHPVQRPAKRALGAPAPRSAGPLFSGALHELLPSATHRLRYGDHALKVDLLLRLLRLRDHHVVGRGGRLRGARGGPAHFHGRTVVASDSRSDQIMSDTNSLPC